MKVHGEAIHETRPFGVYGEGATKTEAGHFKEDFAFSGSDLRFTQTKDGKAVYALALGNPDGGVMRIRSLKKAGDANQISKVEMLGLGPVKFEQTSEQLMVTLPATAMNGIACGVKVTGTGLKALV